MNPNAKLKREILADIRLKGKSVNAVMIAFQYRIQFNSAYQILSELKNEGKLY